MKIYSKIVWDWETCRVVERVAEEWRGPVALCKGASADQIALSKSQAAFYSTLTASYQTMFAGQTAILNSLKTSLEPILKAGPDQFGFTPQETAALRTSAADTTSKEYLAASKTLNEKMAAEGGGNIQVPSGARDELQAALAEQAAGTEAQEQLGITQAGYEVGRQNYWSATSALAGEARTYDPSGAAGAANQGGGQAGQTFSNIAEEEAAASPWSVIGGVAGAALGGQFGGGLAGKLFGSKGTPTK